jgi:hypothetical protein
MNTRARPTPATGHTCSLVSDGFYAVSYCSVGLGLLLGCVFMRLLPRLIALPPAHWRAHKAASEPAAAAADGALKAAV